MGLNSETEASSVRWGQKVLHLKPKSMFQPYTKTFLTKSNNNTGKKNIVCISKVKGTVTPATVLLLRASLGDKIRRPGESC